MAKTTKKDLHAYVRYGGDGRIVPSSVILRRNVPKVGTWVEIDAYECCPPVHVSPYSPICVTGFIENDGFNGTYTFVNILEGKPHYTKENGLYDIYWNDRKWKIGDIATSEDDVATPDLTSTWISDDGAVSVVAGSCTSTTTTTVAPTTTSTTTAR